MDIKPLNIWNWRRSEKYLVFQCFQLFFAVCSFDCQSCIFQLLIFCCLKGAFCIITVHGGGVRGQQVGTAGREEKLFPSVAYFLSTGRVSSGKIGAFMFSICRAEFAALLWLCLAARLPVPLGGLAKCLKLHLNALCSVLIRNRADSLSPLSCPWPHGIPYHVWYLFCFPTPACLSLRSSLHTPVTFWHPVLHLHCKQMACNRDSQGCQCGC